MIIFAMQRFRQPLFLFIAISLASMFGILSVANAAGGGGGGGGGTACSEDVWVCGSWDTCSTDSLQTRSCTLTFDCPNLDTPKPTTTQNCTQITPSPPAEPVVISPIQDEPACQNIMQWACEAWTVCDSNGNQIRSCQEKYKATACLNIVHTPVPELLRRCQTLQCGNKPDLRERIFCRLNLKPAGMARELEIQYLPEECRALTKNEQPACIAKYKSLKPCFELPIGDGRITCARTVLKIGSAMDDREKVFSLIKFRMYDLEDRAEDLILKGVDIGVASDFIAAVEQKNRLLIRPKALMNGVN